MEGKHFLKNAPVEFEIYCCCQILRQWRLMMDFISDRERFKLTVGIPGPQFFLAAFLAKSSAISLP